MRMVVNLAHVAEESQTVFCGKNLWKLSPELVEKIAFVVENFGVVVDKMW